MSKRLTKSQIDHAIARVRELYNGISAKQIASLGAPEFSSTPNYTTQQMHEFIRNGKATLKPLSELSSYTYLHNAYTYENTYSAAVLKQEKTFKAYKANVEMIEQARNKNQTATIDRIILGDSDEAMEIIAALTAKI